MPIFFALWCGYTLAGLLHHWNWWKDPDTPMWIHFARAAEAGFVAATILAIVLFMILQAYAETREGGHNGNSS